MNYMTWQPGEEKRLPFYVPHEKLGLTVVSDAPAADRAVYDWTVTLTPDEPLVLPLQYFEAFELSIYSRSGSAYVYIGDVNVPIRIRNHESHVSMYSYARCPNLKFISSDAVLLRVKQEERNTKNTLRRGDYR
jgi:hypothetical protein